MAILVEEDPHKPATATLPTGGRWQGVTGLDTAWSGGFLQFNRDGFSMFTADEKASSDVNNMFGCSGRRRNGPRRVTPAARPAALVGVEARICYVLVPSATPERKVETDWRVSNHSYLQGHAPASWMVAGTRASPFVRVVVRQFSGAKRDKADRRKTPVPALRTKISF